MKKKTASELIFSEKLLEMLRKFLTLLLSRLLYRINNKDGSFRCALWVQNVMVMLQDIWAQYQFSSVQLSCSVVSDTLWPHESQYARPPCPSPTSGVHSESRPSSPWCHPAISSSVGPSPPAPSPSHHQSFPMSQLFAWGGQSTGASAYIFIITSA